ncbi:MAG: hypothetical protein EZS28_035732 [Streblomastix strix]|uniref:Uncharacterized protein n=1 Tax=Streblomastix strix TaxID=222440 RepID=A0A5J4UFE0_9EUKA|nr:MAG: hypothetical protein EZS28_035732 [Streblomastix strix]
MLSYMAFNKLLLVFILISISLCGTHKRGIRQSFSRTRTNVGYLFEEKVLYFGEGTINDEGELIIDLDDLEYQFDKDVVPFSERNPYRAGTAITNNSFLAVTLPSGGFEELKTSQALNLDEEMCNFVNQTYNSLTYALLGYTALALQGADIAPSITYIMKNYPTKSINRKEGQDDDESVLQQPTCVDNTNNQITFAVHKSGVVGSDCIPNTEVPLSTTECTLPDGIYEKYLVGFKYANFFGGDNDAVKEALIKFGPAFVTNYGQLIIGWDSENWTTVIRSHDTGMYILDTKKIDPDAGGLQGYLYAQVDGDDTPVIPPADCSGKTEAECACIESDTRPFCITCTAKDVPSSECQCPADASGTYTKAQCEEDKASTEKEATGSFRVTLSVIVTAVVLPVLALFI